MKATITIFVLMQISLITGVCLVYFRAGNACYVIAGGAIGLLSCVFGVVYSERH